MNSDIANAVLTGMYVVPIAAFVILVTTLAAPLRKRGTLSVGELAVVFACVSAALGLGLVVAGINLWLGQHRGGELSFSLLYLIGRFSLAHLFSAGIAVGLVGLAHAIDGARGKRIVVYGTITIGCALVVVPVFPMWIAGLAFLPAMAAVIVLWAGVVRARDGSPNTRALTGLAVRFAAIAVAAGVVRGVVAIPGSSWYWDARFLDWPLFAISALAAAGAACLLADAALGDTVGPSKAAAGCLLVFVGLCCVVASIVAWFVLSVLLLHRSLSWLSVLVTLGLIVVMASGAPGPWQRWLRLRS